MTSPASRTCSGSRAPGGTLSSARAARISLTRRISQSISFAATGSSARASAIGQRATISSWSRAPIACHNSSVMNGMNGWSMTRIWSNAQPATALVSSSTGARSPSVVAGLVSSMYQSQKRDQTNW